LGKDKSEVGSYMDVNAVKGASPYVRSNDTYFEVDKVKGSKDGVDYITAGNTRGQPTYATLNKTAQQQPEENYCSIDDLIKQAKATGINLKIVNPDT
jgi:hypothetical protein